MAENSFGHYLDLWLTIKSNSVAATSFRGYKNKAEVHVRPRWGDIQIDQIDHLDLQEWIQGPLSKRLKNKTIRDIISNVRQVFRLYRTRKKVAQDPTEGLFVRLPDPEAPDPFTRAEIKQILETHTSRTQELLMVQFMIWAGPRVSETIAPAWEDVDLKQGTVTFRRSKVRGGLSRDENPALYAQGASAGACVGCPAQAGRHQPAQDRGYGGCRRAGQQDGPQAQAALRIPEHQERLVARQRLCREGQVLQRALESGRRSLSRTWPVSAHLR